MTGNSKISKSIPLAAAIAALAACSPSAENGDERERRDGSGASVTDVETAEVPEAAPPDPALDAARYALQQRIVEIGNDFGGTMGISVIDVESGWSTGFNETVLLPQQSVSKMWVTLAALDAVDRGKLSLDAPIAVRRENLTVFHQPIRSEVLSRGVVQTNPGDLITRAITKSDNTANDVLLGQVGGPDGVRQVLASKQIDNIRFGPGERLMQSAIAGMNWRQDYAYTRQGFYDARDKVPADVREAAFNRYLADPVDGAMPVAIARTLARLARGELLSESSTARFIETMKNTSSGPRRLKGAVRGEWTIAHKTGTGQYWDGRQSGYNDIGLLFAPDGRVYAIAVMIGETRKGVPESTAMMQSVTRAVMDFDIARDAEPEEQPEVE